jgi:tetratricopeptide (TPR) repeat protein
LGNSLRPERSIARLVQALAVVCALGIPRIVNGDVAPVDAPRVGILAADLGSMATIELTWPTDFNFNAVSDSRVLVIDFADAFNAPDIAALRQRLGAWLSNIDKSGHQIRLTAHEDVHFQVLRAPRRLLIELTWATGILPTRQVTVPTDGRIVLTPPGQQSATAAPDRGEVAPKKVPPLPDTRRVVEQPEEPTLDDAAKSAIKRLRRSSTDHRAISSTDVVAGILFQAAKIAAPQLKAELSDDAALLRIDWARQVVLESETDKGELLLRLDHAVDARLVEGLAQRMPEWLESATAGYDTILLVARTGNAFEVHHEGQFTRVRLSAAAAADDEAKSPEDVRLEILRARLKARQGNTGEAREKLDNLQTENPDNADVLVEMANIEESVGSWRRASGLYQRAISLDPDRRDLASATRALDRQNGSQIKIDWDYQQVEDGDLQIPVVLSGRFLPTDMLDAGFRLEYRFLDDNEVLRANGVTQALTINRQRGEVFLGGSIASGHRLEGALLGSQGGPGAAVRYTFQTPDSVTSVNGIWNQAYWELVEGIADEGVQDRFGIRHERQFSQRWSGEAGAGLNRFGIADISTAATTIDLSAAVRYLIPWEAADLTVGYSLNAQYVGTIETRRDANGNAFNPMPLTDTEIHSLDLAVSDVFLNDWRYSIFGSLSTDRFAGGIGPSLGVELFWEPTDDIELGLRAGHSRISGRGDDAVFTRFGGHLLVRF